jgi:LexA DNA binding domain-containing protein
MTYKPTRLSAGAFKELRDIVEREIEKAMSDEEVEEIGINLLHLFDALALAKSAPAKSQPNEQERKALEFVQREIDGGRSPSVRDLSREMGFLSSRSGFRLLNVLIRKGWVHRDESGRLRLG